MASTKPAAMSVSDTYVMTSVTYWGGCASGCLERCARGQECARSANAPPALDTFTLTCIVEILATAGLCIVLPVRASHSLHRCAACAETPSHAVKLAYYLFSICRMLPRTVMRCLQWLKIKPSVAELSGVNAPVKTERFTKELTVEGTIPLELNGLYIRTGPNIQHAPVGGYHLCAPQKQSPFLADSESALPRSRLAL